jgi:molybdopterin-guanine dinucleotide biosynthesis protein A
MTPPGPIRHAAIVLAGGRSARMGQDKAVIAWEGTTLLERAVAELSRIGVVVVVRAPGQELPALHAAAIVTDDAHPDRGPLQGLASGLRAVGAGATAFVCGVDMPLMDAAFALRVLAALDAGARVDAAVPVVGGRPQPLAAAYRSEVADRAEQFLADGGRSLMALLDLLEVRRLDDLPGAAAAVRNVNTPAELEEARQASREKRTREPAAPSSSSPTQASAVAPASDVTA